jgi:galactokinase/mevalonate kinase-like predicted kinase
MRDNVVRINDLLIQQPEREILWLTIIDEYRGRLVKTHLIGRDMEELLKVVANALLMYYEGEVRRINNCLKEQRKWIEEEKKLKSPNMDYIKRIEEDIALNEKELNRIEVTSEIIKRLLETLIFR